MLTQRLSEESNCRVQLEWLNDFVQMDFMGCQAKHIAEFNSDFSGQRMVSDFQGCEGKQVAEFRWDSSGQEFR